MVPTGFWHGKIERNMIASMPDLPKYHLAILLTKKNSAVAVSFAQQSTNRNWPVDGSINDLRGSDVQQNFQSRYKQP
jgi:hypothetical protein